MTRSLQFAGAGYGIPAGFPPSRWRSKLPPERVAVALLRPVPQQAAGKQSSCATAGPGSAARTSHAPLNLCAHGSRPALAGHDVADQSGIDALLDSLDEDPQRSGIGGNTTVATSLAVLHAAAAVRGIPAWKLLNEAPTHIPRPQIQIIGGGAHAAHRTAVQDFMAYPMSATNIGDALSDVAEVYRSVGAIMASRGPVRGVADEGGHWPEVSGTEDALDVLVSGIERAGFKPGIDIGISLDIAASQFHVADGYKVGQSVYGTGEWIDKMLQLCRDYPILTLEDPADEDDPEGMRLAVSGALTTVVGDDYLVTNAERIHRAASAREADSVLVKVNQAGTVTGGAAAVRRSP